MFLTKQLLNHLIKGIQSGLNSASNKQAPIDMVPELNSVLKKVIKHAGSKAGIRNRINFEARSDKGETCRFTFENDGSKP